MINDITLRGWLRTGLAIEAVETRHCARRGSMRRKIEHRGRFVESEHGFETVTNKQQHNTFIYGWYLRSKIIQFITIPTPAGMVYITCLQLAATLYKSDS